MVKKEKQLCSPLSITTFLPFHPHTCNPRECVKAPRDPSERNVCDIEEYL